MFANSETIRTAPVLSAGPCDEAVADVISEYASTRAIVRACYAVGVSPSGDVSAWRRVSTQVAASARAVRRYVQSLRYRDDYL